MDNFDWIHGIVLEAITGNSFLLKLKFEDERQLKIMTPLVKFGLSTIFGLKGIREAEFVQVESALSIQNLPVEYRKQLERFLPLAVSN